MAIAFDSTSSNGGGGPTATPVTWSHTCTGSNRILFVEAFSLNNTVTGVTYAGISMTLIGGTSYPGSGRQGASLYYLIAPATGANNIVISGSSTAGGQAISYTGASQTGQPDSFNAGATSAGSPLTMTTTVVASNCWLVGVEVDGSGGETGGTGTTIRQTDGFGITMSDSNATVGTGSQSLVINYGGGNAAGVVASFSPAVAAAVKSGFFFAAAS